MKDKEKSPLEIMFESAAEAERRVLDEQQAESKAEPEEKKPADELNVDAVFAKLKQIGGKPE